MKINALINMLQTVLRETLACIIEFGPPSGAASNLGLTIVTFADFSDYYYYGDFL